MKRVIAFFLMFVTIVSILYGCSKDPERQLKQLGYENTAQEFLRSVIEHDITAVNLFIEAKISPSSQDKDGCTALMLAIQAGHLRVTKVLLENKADVNGVRGTDGMTAAMLAASAGDIEALQLLRDSGADLRLKSSIGWTALDYAREHVPVVSFLESIEAPSGDRKPQEWFSTEEAGAAFHAAVEDRDVEKARMYIQEGVSPDTMAPNGPALLTAVRNNDRAMVVMLLQEGACVDAVYQDTALMTAAFGGLVEIAELLIDNGASVDIANEYGTALILAARKDDLPIVELLISRGASVNVLGHYGETPLLLACYNGNIEMVRLLLSKGADVHVSTSWNFTGGGDGIRYVSALTMAEIRGYPDIVVLLKAAGAK